MREISRRTFLKDGVQAITAGTVIAQSGVGAALGLPSKRGRSQRVIALDHGWTFAAVNGKTTKLPVSLPHCVADLSWQGWQPSSWEQLWAYGQSFARPIGKGSRERVFLHFDGVMTGCSLVLNGRKLEPNLGGFLPFEREITGALADDNKLEVTVDGSWMTVPPQGSPEGTAQVDYLMPAGIHRSVSLRVLPETFLADVFAKPVDVLTDRCRVEVSCSVDSARDTPQTVRLEAVLLDGTHEVARKGSIVRTSGKGATTANFVMDGLHGVQLWSPDSPKLYNVRVRLTDTAGDAHEYVTRIGFREAKFEVDGFFLNGKRTRLFGLNRHELFPYVGFAMPERVMRHDAMMLKHELNCNSVRCSHYPQTEAFLDACDELGLMVWQEVPGWQYIGDAAWQDLVVRDCRKMIVRDRNHSSIIVWGVRVNESANNVPLYTKTKQVAKSLDDSRQTTGTMTHFSTENWIQDVFAYDDYHARPDGTVGMRDPIPGVPFFFAEGVGQFQYELGKGFKQYYRRAGDRRFQEDQARYHAQGHDRAAKSERCGGLIAWCAFDYASLHNGYNAVKCPGVMDTFRVPKLGAAFYRSQVAPGVRPVIEPGFYWDFGPEAQGGPGSNAHIFSNCEKLVVRIGDRAPRTVQSEREAYPHLPFAPFIVDLSDVRAGHPELVIEGYVGDRLVLTRSFSSDRSQDQLLLVADDAAIAADAQDATRVWFAVADKYGVLCPSLEGDVSVTLDGPGTMVGDRSFKLADTGGVGAVWVKSQGKASGALQVRASHPRFGTKQVTVRLRA